MINNDEQLTISTGMIILMTGVNQHNNRWS